MQASRRNKTPGRIAGVVLLLLGVVGLGLCVAGVAECWVWRTTLIQKVLLTCDRADQVLARVSNGLDRVQASLENAQSQLAVVPRKVAKEDPPALQLAALRFLAPRLTPQLEDSGRTLGNVADAAVVVSNLLEGLEGLPLGPGVPVDINQLRDARLHVTSLGATAEKLLALVGDTEGGHGDEIDSQTAAMQDGVARGLAMIRQLSEQVSSVRDRVTEVRTQFTSWLTTAVVVATVLLAWAGIGQISLALHGWSLCRGRNQRA